MLSLIRALGFRKPFAGPIRPAPNVIERERVGRDPDATEHTVVERWTKL